jgi:hypothetical protein
MRGQKAFRLTSLSHGENRGSSPLGSANDFNSLSSEPALGSKIGPILLRGRIIRNGHTHPPPVTRMLAYCLATEQLVALVCAGLLTVTAERAAGSRRFELAALKGRAGGRPAVSEASPPATIDGVVRVQRPSIEANIGTETARLDKPLRTVVTPLAERLERAEPELVDVAVMWLDVIADFRCPDDTALEAERAQRVFAQLVSSDSTPASRGVPLVPLRLLAANTHS